MKKHPRLFGGIRRCDGPTTMCHGENNEQTVQEIEKPHHSLIISRFTVN
jgi:hypothetical protein